MEGPGFYVEIFVYIDDRRHLHCRISSLEALTEVLEEMRGNRFEMVLVQNRCRVGIGIYDYSGNGLITEDEYGICVGFFATLPGNRQKRVIEQESSSDEQWEEVTPGRASLLRHGWYT